MLTNVDFNIGRTNVAGALTSAAQTSMRTNVDAQKRRVALSSVAQNSRRRQHLLNSPNLPNSLNSCKSCQTCLSQVWGVRAKWFGECRRMYRVWPKQVGECRRMSANVGECRRMSANVGECRRMSANVGECRRMYQVRPIFQNYHFGEYSNLTNSPASGHCLIFLLLWIKSFIKESKNRFWAVKWWTP